MRYCSLEIKYFIFQLTCVKIDLGALVLSTGLCTLFSRTGTSHITANREEKNANNYCLKVSTTEGLT